MILFCEPCLAHSNCIHIFLCHYSVANGHRLFNFNNILIVTSLNLPSNSFALAASQWDFYQGSRWMDSGVLPNFQSYQPGWPGFHWFCFKMLSVIAVQPRTVWECCDGNMSAQRQAEMLHCSLVSHGPCDATTFFLSRPQLGTTE